MSLQLRFNESSQIAKFGCTIACDYFGDSSSRFSRTVAAHDLLLLYIHNGIFFVPVGIRSIASAFGLKGFSSFETVTVSGKPHTLTLAESNVRDARYYANISRNIRLFSDFLTGQVDLIPNFSSEKSCLHDTFFGELITNQSDLQEPYEGFYFYGHYVPMKWTAGRLWYHGVVTQTTPLTMTPGFEWSSTSIFNIVDLLDYVIQQGQVTDVSGSNGGQIRVLSNLSYSLTPESLQITYHSELRTGNSPVPGTSNDVRHWNSKIQIPFGVPGPSVDPVVGNTYYGLLTSNHSVFSYSDGFALYQDAEGQFEDSHVNSDVNELVFLTNPGSYDPSEESRFRLGYIPSKLGSASHNFRDAIRASFDDIVPSSLFSTVSAFKESENSLDLNILQNIQKLPDLASALPRIKEAVDVASRILRHDFSSSTLREVIDLVTKTELQRSFEWRPFLDVFTTYIPRLAEFWALFGRTSQRAIGRGSFRFKLPEGSLGRKDVTLITRTKLVMDTSQSKLLSSLLGADAIGILPKPSNLWDLIPFTFVVNWFTGIGGAIRRAEYSAILLSLPAYFVHSYTLTSPFTSDELAAWNLSSSSEEPAGLKAYYRDLSFYSPIPRDSRFGFGIPTGIPIIGTAGSLLYQLIYGL